MEIKTGIEPSNEWKYRFIKGKIADLAPWQYCNWAAEYLDRPERFSYNDLRVYVGYSILNDACVKRLKDIGVI